MIDARVRGLVGHLFRHQAGRMVAALARALGAARLDVAEEAVQEALLRALRLWPFQGVPDNPEGWLFRVARNAALDRLRRDATIRTKAATLEREIQPPDEPAAEIEVGLAGEVSDDQLRLLFLCCHPELSRDAQVALTLNLAAGFSVGEIARAFLAEETAIAQRVVRAKRRLRECGASLELPGPGELVQRLDAVLEVLYLMFSAGYSAHVGEDLVRAELCAEALRLGEALAAFRPTARPEAHALLALMYLQASRLPARTDQRGNLLVLAEQDRALWDDALMARGFRHLERSAARDRLTSYHIEAAIAACHAEAKPGGTPDWHRIRALYEDLYAINPSPVVALNRAVAVARAGDPETALTLLDSLDSEPQLQAYHLFHATRGQLLVEVGRPREAALAFAAALLCPCSEPERRLLASRLAAARAP